MARLIYALLALALLAPTSWAQFDVPASTPVREKYVGNLVGGSITITPEGGDQIAAFARDEVIGLFTFDAAAPGVAYDLTAYGDDPDTPEREGPDAGDRVTFRYFDISTNTTFDLEALNEQGERTNVTYQGQLIPPLPIELPGFDLTPSRAFDLRPGNSTDGGGGGGGASGDAAKYDINGDGKVNQRDVAAVLSLVIRGGDSEVTTGGASADVNGDGSITTADAIEVIRNK